ncbi:DUF58 domain-containing protein [Malaciobacter mytili LMG 24559]|uniref:DUF58 domain-containing protein n=1 Tax=Malaciobacter mytili LMG 24559 TaxID=1032238 RepID=A0AAX2AEB1_9BACT|nr:DUF58 domain-containing protein [Malaciobacter mytili]AXH14224.1 DUF58 domain-containing protein [Malaciobacter mytili LMG 24559]RXK15332.1 DUF58 domain-containing protein [Malaciobacter mytili LMG 24559]
MNSKIKKILIKSKKEVFSEIVGNNLSKLKGEGYDFSELKEYEYGEDVKNIDWIISAKLQKPYVKVFHAQKELNINIIPILNGTVFFGTDKFKQELICEISTLLGFSAIKQGDTFSSYIANEDLLLCSKKSKRNFSVEYMAEKIYNYKSIGKKVNYELISNKIFKTLKRRSLIFLIGDFFQIEKLDLKILSKKHEVIVIIVRDYFEENISTLGSVNFKDLEKGFEFRGVIDKYSVENYIKSLKENDHKLFEHLRKCNIDFTKIYTKENPISKLIRLMK